MPNPSTIARDMEKPAWVKAEGLNGSEDVLPEPVDENAELLRDIYKLERYCEEAEAEVAHRKQRLKEARDCAKEYQKKLRSLISASRQGLPMFDNTTIESNKKGKNNDDRNEE